MAKKSTRSSPGKRKRKPSQAAGNSRSKPRLGRKETRVRSKKPRSAGIDQQAISAAIRTVLSAVGENPNRRGLKDTPGRVADLYAHLFEGLGRNAAEELSVYTDTKVSGTVVVKSVPFYSVCEHHLVPFFGTASVAYAPRDGRIASFGGIQRVVEIIAHRPQLQETLTREIAQTIQRALRPAGVLVVVEAEHLCFSIGSVKRSGSRAVTTASTGTMKRESTRTEAMRLIRN